MAAHAEYGMSSIERWASCPRSIALCKGLPSYDSEWSIDGTIAHAVMEFCLKEGFDTAADVQEVLLDGKDRHVVTDECQRAVQVMLDYVYGILRDYPDAVLSVERRVHVPSLAVPGDMWGTLDVRIYVPSIAWLWIADYKHGVGINVDVTKSKQLRGYATASMLELANAGHPIKGITLAIVQPRAYSASGGVRPVDITPAELFAFHAFLEDRAYETLRLDAPLVPDLSTDSYCRWCPAAGAGRCPAIEGTALAVTQATALAAISKDNLPDPKLLALDKMHYVLTVTKLLTGWLKAVKETAIGHMRSGQVFPGWKLVFSQARRAWHGDEMAIAQQLAVYTGKTIEEVYPRVLIGVTEAENLMIGAYRAGIVQLPGETKRTYTARLNAASELARETMALLTLKQPGGGTEIVPLSDPRTAIDGAATFFAGKVNMEGL